MTALAQRSRVHLLTESFFLNSFECLLIPRETVTDSRTFTEIKKIFRDVAGIINAIRHLNNTNYDSLKEGYRTIGINLPTGEDEKQEFLRKKGLSIDQIRPGCEDMTYSIDAQASVLYGNDFSFMFDYDDASARVVTDNQSFSYVSDRVQFRFPVDLKYDETRNVFTFNGGTVFEKLLGANCIREFTPDEIKASLLLDVVRMIEINTSVGASISIILIPSFLQFACITASSYFMYTGDWATIVKLLAGTFVSTIGIMRWFNQRILNERLGKADVILVKTIPSIRDGFIGLCRKSDPINRPIKNVADFFFAGISWLCTTMMGEETCSQKLARIEKIE